MEQLEGNDSFEDVDDLDIDELFVSAQDIIIEDESERANPNNQPISINIAVSRSLFRIAKRKGHRVVF